MLNNFLQEEFQNHRTFNSIPCLYENPDETLAEWSMKASAYFKEEEIFIKHLQSRINNQKNDLTKKRLNSLLQGRSYNLKQIKKLLSDISKNENSQTIFSSQQIHSYFELAFRDWSWGEKEIDSYLKIAEGINFENKSVLILGSGAGGFSQKLAEKKPSAQFINVEHNPLLATIHNQIANGKEVKLHEVCEYPKEMELTCVKRRLKTQKKIENQTVILASFPDLPFKDNIFDIIIAPWFFDILDLPFINAIVGTKDFLKPEGSLLFFGPSNIHKKELNERLCSEEIIEVFQDNFNEVSSFRNRISYLDSPLSSQNRQEEVLFIQASHSKEYTKDFNLDFSGVDLKFTPEFEQYKLVADIKAKILSHINEDISVDGLAKVLEEKFGLTSHESKPYAKKFLDKIKFEY